jgi:hypothetical protein
VPQTATPIAHGQPCAAPLDVVGPNVCADGAICLDLFEDGDLRCVAFCDCPAGFDIDGLCLGTASQCGAGEECLQATATNDRIGLCADVL